MYMDTVTETSRHSCKPLLWVLVGFVVGAIGAYGVYMISLPNAEEVREQIRLRANEEAAAASEEVEGVVESFTEGTMVVKSYTLLEEKTYTFRTDDRTTFATLGGWIDPAEIVVGTSVLVTADEPVGEGTETKNAVHVLVRQ